jgi:hypothetical protein
VRPGGGVVADTPSLVFMKGVQGSARERREVRSRMRRVWRPTSEKRRLQRSERCRVDTGDIPQRPEEPQSRSLAASHHRMLYTLVLPFILRYDLMVHSSYALSYALTNGLVVRLNAGKVLPSKAHRGRKPYRRFAGVISRR